MARSARASVSPGTEFAWVGYRYQLALTGVGIDLCFLQGVLMLNWEAFLWRVFPTLLLQPYLHMDSPPIATVLTELCCFN